MYCITACICKKISVYTFKAVASIHWQISSYTISIACEQSACLLTVLFIYSVTDEVWHFPFPTFMMQYSNSTDSVFLLEHQAK